MKRILVVLALLLLAAPAWAKTWVVPGTDTFAAALAATAGDVVQLAAGSYGSLAPTGTGNAAQPVIWIGSGSCTVSGIVPKSYHRFYSITSTAGVDMPTDGKRVMFNGCTLGSLNFLGADSSSARNCTIGGGQFRCARAVTGGALADADTLEGCTFTSLNTNSTEPAMLFGDNATGVGDANTDSCRYFVQRFNVFNISQTGTTTYTASKHYECPNFTSYGNRYVITSDATGAGDEGNYGVLFRDASYNLRMKRDTIYINNESGTQSQYCFMFASGMSGNEQSNHSATIDSCYFRVFRGSAMWSQAAAPGLKMRYNVLRSRLGTALDFYGLFSSSNDPYIHHNTMLGKQAVYFAEGANTGGFFSNNILWGTSTSSCDAYEAVGGTTGNLTSISDSNFVYSTTNDSTKSFCKTACNSPRAGAWSATWSNDTHSYWGNPALTDTTWTSLNVTPIAGNFAIAGGRWTLGYAGASDGTVPAGTPPPASPPPPPPAVPRTVDFGWGGVDSYLWYFTREDE